MGFGVAENIKEKIRAKVVSIDNQRKENEVKNNEFQKIKNEILILIDSLANDKVVDDIPILKNIIEKLKKNIYNNFDHYNELPILLLLNQKILDILEKKNELNNYSIFLKDANSNDDLYRHAYVDSSGNTTQVDYTIDEIKFKKDKIHEILGLELLNLNNIVDDFSNIKKSFNNTLPVFIANAIDDVNGEILKFRKRRNIADNLLTEDIYNEAVVKYQKLEKDYRSYFYWGIGIILLISVFMFLIKQFLVPRFFNSIEFWIVKLSVIAVGITLISYFIKQSSHYQRLADQNYQTQVELQAYPSFMESIPTEEAASVRKELALKYFGREIDGAAHKDMSNLISDQMKSTTDMVKATTEAIKNLNGTAK